MGWLLALDGATESLALALVAPDGVVFARAHPGGAQASTALIPAVLTLLGEHKVRSSQLTAIGFGQGPGAFTGLRAVCSVVQGLAWGWNCPVLPLDSLLIPVEDGAASNPAEHWGSVMDARMNQCYAARYRRVEKVWRCVEVPGLWNPEALREAWTGDQQPEAWAGNAVDGIAHATPPTAGSAPAELARAAALGRLCWQAAQCGEGIDAARATPVYVRDKVALTTAERAALALRA